MAMPLIFNVLYILCSIQQYLGTFLLIVLQDTIAF